LLTGHSVVDHASERIVSKSAALLVATFE
jgi:hypothetical protein